MRPITEVKAYCRDNVNCAWRGPTGACYPDEDGALTCPHCGMTVDIEYSEQERNPTPVPKVIGATKMSEWQPIETAPHDGAFLVTDGAYIAEVFPRGKSGGFHTTSDGYEFGDATHWMPAPALPSNGEVNG